MRYFLLFALAASLAAQEKLVETIEVRVVNIDVVVTDRSGNPVPGLTKDDFEVLENGKPQTITNFYEIRPGVAPLPAARGEGGRRAGEGTSPPRDDLSARRFVFLIDNYSLDPAQRNTTLAAVRRFLDANLKPNDEASLYIWSRKAEMVTPLTSDKAEILRGIDAASARSRTGMSAQEEEERARRVCLDIMQEVDGAHLTWDQAWLHCQGGVRSFTDVVWANETTFLRDLKSIITTLAGIDGRKVLVLAGGKLPQHPGQETMLWAAQQFDPHLPKLHLPTRAFSEGVARTQTFAITDIATFANANGVAFYTIDAADMRDAAGAASPIQADYGEAFSSFADTASAFKALADITGGAALSGTHNFDVAFQTLARDLSSFYSIGYNPPAEGADNRKITIRVKKPGLTARARQSYTPKSSDQEMNDRVIANLFHHGAKGEWPIALTAGMPQANGDRFNLPLTIAMQPNITLIPQEQKLVGGFVLYVVVGTKEGAMSKVTKNARKVEIPLDAESQLRAAPMTFKLMLSVRPGQNIISVGVADQISNAAGFDRLEVAAK